MEKKMLENLQKQANLVKEFRENGYVALADNAESEFFSWARFYEITTGKEVILKDWIVIAK